MRPRDSAFLAGARKAISAVVRAYQWFHTIKARLYVAAQPDVSAGSACTYGAGAQIRATDGQIVIGSGVHIGEYAQILCRGGELRIGDNVYIGPGCIIVCAELISIASDTLIAEYVVIRDQDHRSDTRPIKAAGLRSSPVHIGRDVWIGAKASVLRGSRIGDRSIVAAHSLVKGDVPPDTTVFGIPARPRSQPAFVTEDS